MSYFNLGSLVFDDAACHACIKRVSSFSSALQLPYLSNESASPIATGDSFLPMRLLLSWGVSPRHGFWTDQIWTSTWTSATLKARIPTVELVSASRTFSKVSKAQHVKNHQLSMLARALVIARVSCLHKLSQQQHPLPCLHTRTFANVAYQSGKAGLVLTFVRTTRLVPTQMTDFNLELWICACFMGKCMGHSLGPRFTWYWTSANDVNMYDTHLGRVLCIMFFLYPAASCLQVLFAANMFRGQDLWITYAQSVVLKILSWFLSDLNLGRSMKRSRQANWAEWCWDHPQVVMERLIQLRVPKWKQKSRWICLNCVHRSQTMFPSFTVTSNETQEALQKTQVNQWVEKWLLLWLIQVMNCISHLS